MSYILLGIGLVLVIEGLVFALAPSRLDQVLDAIRNLPIETRRLMGLTSVAIGVLVLWIAKALGL
jgi:uncharacterized protein YjeT (DUF2065 family)